jgi:Domain of unknown function (DUF5615)
MLPLLIDENLNQQILRGLKRQAAGLDVLVVQDVGLQGATDPEVLAWAAERRRVLVTHDVNTIPNHAYQRIESAESMPGVIVIPGVLAVSVAIAELTLVNECSTADECENRILYLPI